MLVTMLFKATGGLNAGTDSIIFDSRLEEKSIGTDVDSTTFDDGLGKKIAKDDRVIIPKIPFNTASAQFGTTYVAMEGLEETKESSAIRDSYFMSHIIDHANNPEGFIIAFEGVGGEGFEDVREFFFELEDESLFILVGFSFGFKAGLGLDEFGFQGKGLLVKGLNKAFFIGELGSGLFKTISGE